MTDLSSPETMINEGGPIEATPQALQALGEVLTGADIISTPASVLPVETFATAENPNGALVILTEGTAQHETFKQEFHEFLTSVKRDTAEIIAWLRKRL